MRNQWRKKCQENGSINNERKCQQIEVMRMKNDNEMMIINVEDAKWEKVIWKKSWGEGEAAASLEKWRRER